MINNEFIIRKIDPSEYKSLINIWIKSSLPYKPEGRDTEQNILNQIQVKTHRFFVAEVNKELVAVVIASHNGRKGWINRLAVVPEFRGKGIATALLNKSEEFFLSNSVNIFACLIEDWNDISMEYFENKNYRSHKDIVYFTKKLSPNT